MSARERNKNGAGKGDARRPMSCSYEQWSKNYDRIFSNKKENKDGETQRT